MEFSHHFNKIGNVWSVNSGFRLEVAKGPSSHYRLAQIDDYSRRRRKDFIWEPPLTLSLQARASDPNIPGTWGFGLWNDPFGTCMGLGGMKRPFPALPNAVWFFHASQDNFLSLKKDAPANGFIAATFRSLKIPALLLLPLIAVIPLLLTRPTARWLRSRLSQVIVEDSANLDIDVTDLHQFTFSWEKGTVRFWVDDLLKFETAVSSIGPLGCVIWIDNQYASFTPAGEIKAGTLENSVAAWIEISNLVVK